MTHKQLQKTSSFLTSNLSLSKIADLLGENASYLLDHRCETVSKESLHLPNADWVDEIFYPSNRNSRVLKSLASLFNSGRLAGTGYLSILPVDQGIEHSAGASFAANPDYFDPENIIKLAIEGGCNAVATTYGCLAAVSRKYAHKIPLILKFNHNELLSYPNSYNQIPFASIDQAYEMGCVGIGATIYFGSEESEFQIQQVSEAFERAHQLGMCTILWCYLRNNAFAVNGTDYHTAADITSQANHLGVTIGADIIKQKLPTNNGGFSAIKFGKSHPKMYDSLCSDHPIDLTRYQVVNNYMGRMGLINSGGASGSNDLKDALETAIINKRAGGMGLISGRKAFQKPLNEGIALLNAIQDVYLNPEISIA